MFIRTIHDDDWPEILKIQSAVYSDIEPETETVLRSKAVLSQDTCVVLTDTTGNIMGYGLAHPWGEEPAHLHAIYSEYQHTTQLYIHDIAVSPQHRGKQFGSSLFKFMLAKAKAMNIKTVGLVSLKQALSFWQRHGFEEQDYHIDQAEYGDGARFLKRQL